MNTKQAYWFFLLGILFIGSGIFLLATDYNQIRENYKKLYYSFSRQMTPNLIKEQEPKLNTPEKLKSDLKMAEEYLRQNSYESIRKALDIYNRVLSFSEDTEITQLSKYGLSYSLFRLNDENRSLQILRELKKEKIVNPILEEEINFLLGKILLLRGHEDEGKSILQSLLAKTDSSDLKSRIHVAFGDYYYLKKEYKKAKKSYLIALEYNPDNLHAGILKQNLVSKKKIVPFEHEYYDQYLFKTILDKLDKKEEDLESKISKKPQKLKTETEKETKRNFDEIIENLEKKFVQSKVFINMNDYLSANNLLIEIEKESNELLQNKEFSLLEKQKNDLYKLLESVFYQLGELSENQKKNELAKSYYDKVLENPNTSLDQASLIRKGILYFEENQYKQAYKMFKKAINIEPNGKLVDKAREWLQETEKILREQENSIIIE
ncbi:MAG: tetratricopeptide repeat protein [Leptonema sp. (in: bacteria)]